MMPCRAVAAILLMVLFAGGARGQDPDQLTGLQAALIMEKAMVDSIARAEKSVVAIARIRLGGPEAKADPTDPQFVPHEYGTGVVIDQAGLILTNYHVLGDPDPDKNTYYVWIDRKPFRVQEVLAADPWNDLAVLEIDAKGLQPITFGDGSKVKKGQIVFALGNPYAIARDGQVSASWGIISNVSRKATRKPTESNRRAEPGGTLHHLGTLIQTDAKLNMGTSGGALINLKGEMIGLTTSVAAMQQYEQSAGFAIPVDDVFRRVVNELKKRETPDFGFLGVQVKPLATEQRQQGRIGVELEGVVPGTPAGQAGLRPGDILTHVNDKPIRDHIELMRELAKQPAAASVRVAFQRGPLTQTRSVKLSKKYIESTRPSYSSREKPAWRGVRVDFATAIPHFFYKSHQIDPNGCVAIVEVDRESAGWKSGLRPWTFVNFVDGERVSTPKDFYGAVQKRSGNVRLRLTVAEGSNTPIRTVSP